MTDPVAEAAAQLAADPSSTDPGLLHPDQSAVVAQAGEADAAPAAAAQLDTSATTSASAAASEETPAVGEPGNAPAVAEASATAPATAEAGNVSAPPADTTGTDSAATSASPSQPDIAAASVASGSNASSDVGNGAVDTPPAGIATPVNAAVEGEDVPNVAAAPAESQPESATSSSAPSASPAADTEANASNAGANEHPHTSLLRGLVATLRRKWNVFDAELENAAEGCGKSSLKPMRPFKNKLSPSLDVLLATLVVGVPYTPRRLGLMFEGGAPAVLTLLERAISIGAVRCSGRVRGYTTRYWLSSTYTPGRTPRPLQPADMHGELTGYDLMARARLCGTFRRQ